MSKKVISFSVWGAENHFWRGAIENARLALEHYPGWECRFHIPVGLPTLSDCWTQELLAIGNSVLRRQDPPSPGKGWIGLFWRLASIWDPGVEATIVRDADSRLSAREAAAVEEWLAGGRLFHHMRDHIEHTTVPVMGGMLGCRHWPRMQELLADWCKFDAKGADQDFLERMVWPEVRGDALCHDRWPDGCTWVNNAAEALDYAEALGKGDPGLYRYAPEKFFGPHLRRPYPTNPVGAEYVGARVP